MSKINVSVFISILSTVIRHLISVKNFERVEAIPHMYINVDAPPPMTVSKKFYISAAMSTHTHIHTYVYFCF